VKYTNNIIILDPIGLAPRTHDKGVVERQDGDDVDLLALDLIELLDIARQMADGAARCERPWYGEEDHLLVSPFLGGVVVYRNAAGCDLRGFGCVGDIARGELECQLGCHFDLSVWEAR